MISLLIASYPQTEIEEKKPSKIKNTILSNLLKLMEHIDNDYINFPERIIFNLQQIDNKPSYRFVIQDLFLFVSQVIQIDILCYET